MTFAFQLNAYYFLRHLSKEVKHDSNNLMKNTSAKLYYASKYVTFATGSIQNLEYSPPSGNPKSAPVGIGCSSRLVLNGILIMF